MAGPPHGIPPYLEPVLDFVNTIDIEDRTDLVTSPAELSGWLYGKGLLAAGESATPAQFRLAIELRQVLRAFTLANNGIAPSTEDVELAARCFDRLPAVATPDEPVLTATSRTPVLAALTGFVIGYVIARAAGEWDRLRQCPAGDCAWNFWDSSPRGARRWCSMRVCGNRAKARTYASRHR